MVLGYLANAAHIASVMAHYAALGEPHGLRNGVRAAGALGRAVAARVMGRGGRRCGLCGWTGPRFGPMYYVDEYREEICCYGCGSTDRARLAKLIVERRLGGFFNGARRRVLDIGPSRGSRGFFPREVDYVAFDLCSPLATVHGDLCAAPFPDAYCDLWICFHVLDYIEDDEQAMRELFRVLRPGGIGLLDHAMRWDADTEEYGVVRERESHHRRRYGRDLPDRLRAIGFEVEVLAAEDVADEAAREEQGIHPRRVVICRRPQGAGSPGPRSSR